MTAVSVPATSANLGPGFDALGMALSMRAVIGVVGVDEPVERAVVVDEFHPATVAFRSVGGTGDLWVRSPIPMGRGLGYSGAMRVGGAARALVGEGLTASTRAEVFTVAAALEGHGDNAAASVYGGVVATHAGSVVAVPCALEPDVVVWVPSQTTSTESSRASLAPTVSFADAAANIGRTAMLVAALGSGDVFALREATVDLLHQPMRLAAAPASAAVLRAGVELGAWCGWLSGSGPTVALLTEPGAGEALAAGLVADRDSIGSAKVLRLDRAGVHTAGS